jgi:hypothetical protein
MEQYRELWESHQDSLDSIKWPSWKNGTRIKYLQSGNKNLRLQEFTSDFVDPTWCDKGHVGFVIQGELEIDFQEGRKVYFPEGSELFINAGDKHKARSITSTALLFLVEDR